MTTTSDEIPSPQAPLTPSKHFSSRFLALAKTWRWGLIIVGLILAVGGSILIYSTTSQLAAYQSIRGILVHLDFIGEKQGVIEGNVTFANGAIFHIRGSDYSPHLDILKDLVATDVEFIYRSDNTVVQVTIFGSSSSVGSRHPFEVFTTSGYAQITQNRTLGIVVLIVGLTLAAFAFIAPVIRARLGKNKKQAVPNIVP